MSNSTRLRYAASSSPEGLAAFIQGLPFKVEIKSIAPMDAKWFCWFVLPDNIINKELDAENKTQKVELPSINLDEI